MPQPFNNAVMTNAGARLLTRAQAGEIKIEFTRIATGNGIYTEDEKSLDFLKEQTALKSIKNSFALSDIKIYSEHSVKITTLITNQDPVTGETLIDEGYYINEMGLFAKEKDGSNDTEVLYSIVVTSGENGDFMPPYNGYNPAQITQEYFATVSNSAQVTINVTGAVATAEQVQALKYAIGREKLQQLLPTGETTITFTAEKINENSSINVYASIPGLDYTGITVSGNDITITFEEQEEDVYITVILSDVMV